MRISDWSSDVCSSDLEQQRQAKRLDERALEPDEIEPELRQAEPRALIDAGERAGGREFERDAGPVSRHFRGAERDDSARRIVDDVARAGDRKSVVSGKSVSVLVDLGGLRIIKNK